MIETYKTCEDCGHWHRNTIKNSLGVCLIDWQPSISKWPRLTACQKFKAIMRSTQTTQKK